MQTQSGIPARFANCFLEGISTPQRFAEGLRLLAEALNCEQASVKFWDKRGGWASLRKARHIDAGWQLIAEDLAQPPSEWLKLAAVLEHGSWKPIRPLRESRFAHPSAQEGVPALLQLQCLRLPPLRGVEALLLMGRRRTNSQESMRNLSVPADLMKILRTALELTAEFRQLSYRATYSNVLLDTIRLPLLMLDHSLRLLAANRHAETLIEPVPLGAARHCVCLRGLSVNRFSSAVRAACDLASPMLGSVLIAAGSGGAQQRILVLPLMVRHSGRSERAALVLVHGQGESQASAQTLLQQAYGLTPAEARLAILILEGHSPGDAAASLQVRIATVRTQLSAILKKTGARKQAELVRRLSPLLVLDRQQSAH